MTWYPACASTPEDDGPTFDPPVMGMGLTRLREAVAFSRVARETADFHEAMAKRHGVDSPLGLAHYKASRAYREAKGASRLQELFEKGELGELDPKAIVRANKSAVAFHKKAAEKAGLDSDEGHAHVAALENHLDIIRKAKKQQEAKFGHTGRELPLPVPKKSEQPSEDIRQKKPIVPLRKLQQTRDERVQHKTRPVDTLVRREKVFRGKLQKEAHVDQRYDKSHPEGFVDQRYADLKRESRKRARESRSDEGQPIVLASEKPKREKGWRSGIAYSPPLLLPEESPQVDIKEF